MKHFEIQSQFYPDFKTSVTGFLPIFAVKGKLFNTFNTNHFYANVR
jgi:hypothetical protein